tara:strand:+ start:1887 stop:2114 length:228 start_codon:yes stop_codon:yes gene_type:complete
MGAFGLFGLGNFIPVLATKIAGIDITLPLNRTFETSFFVAIISLAIIEEILFPRILAQKLYNCLGLKKKQYGLLH